MKIQIDAFGFLDLIQQTGQLAQVLACGALPALFEALAQLTLFRQSLTNVTERIADEWQHGFDPLRLVRVPARDFECDSDFLSVCLGSDLRLMGRMNGIVQPSAICLIPQNRSVGDGRVFEIEPEHLGVEIDRLVTRSENTFVAIRQLHLFQQPVSELAPVNLAALQCRIAFDKLLSALSLIEQCAKQGVENLLLTIRRDLWFCSAQNRCESVGEIAARSAGAKAHFVDHDIECEQAEHPQIVLGKVDSARAFRALQIEDRSRGEQTACASCYGFAEFVRLQWHMIARRRLRC